MTRKAPLNPALLKPFNSYAESSHDIILTSGGFTSSTKHLAFGYSGGCFAVKPGALIRPAPGGLLIASYEPLTKKQIREVLKNPAGTSYPLFSVRPPGEKYSFIAAEIAERMSIGVSIGLFLAVVFMPIILTAASIIVPSDLVGWRPYVGIRELLNDKQFLSERVLEDKTSDEIMKIIKEIKSANDKAGK